MRAIDWALVLEYVKVLAPLGVAVWAASLVVRNYRAQRRLDLRSQWYQETHKLLGTLANAYQVAAYAQAEGDSLYAEQRMGDLVQASRDVTQQLAGGFLFGKRDDLYALRYLGHDLETLNRRMRSEGITPEIGAAGAFHSLGAANAMAVGYRKEMGLPAVNLEEIDKQVQAAIKARS